MFDVYLGLILKRSDRANLHPTSHHLQDDTNALAPIRANWRLSSELLVGHLIPFASW